jgi:hypothetical protein
MLGKGTAALKSALEQSSAEDTGTLAAIMGQVSLNETASAADGTTQLVQHPDRDAQRILQVLRPLETLPAHTPLHSMGFA